MNPVVIQIANGNAFFIGIGMTAFAFVLRLRLNRRLEVILLTAAWLIGISLVIPKRYLVKVFASKDDTVDGLHLSQKGHTELAKSIYDLLKIEN